MRIVQIIPGSGGTFYCQNCLRDHALAKALRAAGHDVILAPLYLPMFADDPAQDRRGPVFYGAVSLYLHFRWPWLRKAPASFRRLLDSPRVLKWAAAKAGSTDPKGLGAMTLAMLRGEAGPMAGELATLLAWLSGEDKPDVIYVSNALLLGMAPELKRRLGVPIICSLQDETQWLDPMESPFREQVWDLMAQRARHVDTFVAVSRYYAGVMQPRLQLSAGQLEVVPLGIDLEGYPEPAVPPPPPALGYLSKITEALGFGILAGAFVELKKDERLKRLQLHATGGLLGHDIRFVNRLRKRLAAAGFGDDLVVHPVFDRPGRIRFLQRLSVLSVPVPGGDAFGSYLLEAMAAGVPVVQPKAGSFPEVIQRTGGGILYEPNTDLALAAALKPLLLDPDKAQALATRGRRAVFTDYSIERMADDMLTVFRRAVRPTHAGERRES